MATLLRAQRQKLSSIELLLMDVDGTMTNGGIWISGAGEECKCFDVKDGMGIAQLRLAGIKTGIVSARVSRAAAVRAGELKIPVVLQGLQDKARALDALREKNIHTPPERIAYIGDDVNDLPLLRIAGFSAAPRDAVPAVRRAVDYVCAADGGRGAVRELCDMLLRAQRRFTSSSR